MITWAWQLFHVWFRVSSHLSISLPLSIRLEQRKRKWGMKSRKFNLIKWLLSFPCLLFTLLSISRFLDLLLLLFKTFWYYRDSHSMRNELECVLKSLSRKDKKKCDMKWNWKYQKKTGSSHLKDRLIVNYNFDPDSMSLASCHEIWTFSSTFPSSSQCSIVLSNFGTYFDGKLKENRLEWY